MLTLCYDAYKPLYNINCRWIQILQKILNTPLTMPIRNMPVISVLLIGASGALGKPLLDELLRQRHFFERVAILTTPDRASKFKDIDVEVIAKALTDAEAYQGPLPQQ